MELYQLKYFKTLCSKAGHYSKAAQELFLTPSALTTAIKKIENEIGLPLIDRTNNSFTLTPAGQELLKTADAVIYELDSLQERLDSLANQKIFLRMAVEHMAFSGSFVESLDRFSQVYPNVEVSISRRAGESIRQLVLSGELDLGITIHQNLENSRLTTEPYTSAEYGLYCSSPLPDSVVRLRELSGTTLKLLNYTGDIESPLTEYFSKSGVTLQKGSITNLYPDSAWQLIRDGLGMAVFPLDIQKMDNRVFVYPFDPPLELQYDFVTGNHSSINRLLRVLKEFLRREDSK
jgi:DNA-binding transcriptional LysR family regulator